MNSLPLGWYARPRFTRSQHAIGFASGGWAGTCFQIIGAPSLVRSSANTMFGNALCTYITVPITSGFPSWPFSTPVENVQVALRFFTFALLIAVSGLYRCRTDVRPVMVHWPYSWSIEDAVYSTIRLAASPPDSSLKRFIADLMLRMRM